MMSLYDYYDGGAFQEDTIDVVADSIEYDGYYCGLGTASGAITTQYTTDVQNTEPPQLDESAADVVYDSLEDEGGVTSPQFLTHNESKSNEHKPLQHESVDINEQYQILYDRFSGSSSVLENVNITVEMHNLCEKFSSSAQRIGQQIIDDMRLPVVSRKYRPLNIGGIAGECQYLSHYSSPFMLYLSRWRQVSCGRHFFQAI
jgi:hypothetical protein